MTQTQLNELRDAVYNDAKRHGLYEMWKPATMEQARTMAINRIDDEVIEASNAVDNGQAFEEEVADVLLTLLSVCGYLGIDIGAITEKKRIINISRPYMHLGEKK